MAPTVFTKIVFGCCTLINRKDLRWKLKQQYPATFFLPHLLRDEYALFKKTFAPAKTVLEYGTGGSTIHFLNTKKTVFSVESNQEFYSYLSAIGLVKNSLKKNLSLRYVDLGATNEWGKPVNNEGQQGWSKYYADVWNEIDPAVHKVDAIFIDGRFRVACALYAILKILNYQWKDTQIVIHDFWRRKEYHVVLEFLDNVATASQLAVFRVKKNIDTEKVKSMLDQYALVAR